VSFSTTDQLGLAFRFDVVIDGFNLGSWSSCKGLGVTFKHEKITELGQHAYTTNIPGRADYTQITLQRAMKAGDWTTTKAWLEQVTGDSWLTGGSHESSATITLRDAKLEEVASWTLKNAMPVSWKGPQLDAGGKTVATETLDLVHEGFLDD
jgi:phage tail-like protein